VRTLASQMLCSYKLGNLIMGHLIASQAHHLDAHNENIDNRIKASS
jgi:hypothetical protein